jgi:hypothetical protein
MSERTEYIDKLAAQLKEWDSDIQTLELEMKKASADAKEKYRTQLEDLMQKKEQAYGKLRKVQEAGDNAWKELKSGTEKAFETMKSSVESAMDEVKK